MNQANETLRTIHSLCSTHGNFTDQEVRSEDLQTILDASVRAANASARQSYSIIVVEDRALMKTLCGFQGSKALVFCIDYTRIVDAAEHLGHTFSAEGIIPFVTGSTDAILVAQTAAIAARSLGIDSLFTNGIHRGNMDRVYDLLGLPTEHCFPLIVLILGYADQEPVQLKGRLAEDGVIHRGRYQRPTAPTLDAMIDRYDDPASHLALNETWKEAHDHYLDWFYAVWSARGGKRSGKSQMFELLERAGFIDADQA